MHMHGAELCATVQARHCLAGVQQSLRIEGLLQCEEGFQFSAAELQTHLVQLLDADAMFAGHGAADRHAAGENATAELHGALHLLIVVRIEANQGMQIAIAGVKHIGHWQVEFTRQRTDIFQHCG